MADNNDKLELETGGDLDKNKNSDLGSSSQSADLEIENLNSANASTKKKDKNKLEINLETTLPTDDIAGAAAAAVVLGNQEEEAENDLSKDEIFSEIPTLENEIPTLNPPPTEQPKPKENNQPTDQKVPPSENEQPKKSSPPNGGLKQPQKSLQPNSDLNQPQPPQEETDSPQLEPNQAPPTIDQQPQAVAAPMDASPEKKAPPKINPAQTKIQDQPTNLRPPTVGKEDLANIGPHGQPGGANYSRDQKKTPPLASQSPGANETLNSPKLTQPGKAETSKNQIQQATSLSANQQTGVAKDLASQKQQGLSWAETKKIQEDNYNQLDEQKKQNEAKQKKKLLKKLSKQNEKLIGPIEKMLLRSYFPFVTQKIIDAQDEINKLIKKEQRAKTRSGHNKISGKISNLIRLVIEPTLKISSFRDAIRRFRNFWLSWSVELWWWTVIMAIFDLIIVFPIFLFINFVFAGRSTRMLEKIKKRSYDIMELGNKLNDITMKNIKERLNLSASSRVNKSK